MIGKRKRSCLDTQAAPPSVNGPEIDSRWTRWRGKTVFLSVFISLKQFSRIARSTPRGPISLACEGLYFQHVQTYPSKKSTLIRGAVSANISGSGERPTAHRALVFGDWYHGINAQTVSTTLALGHTDSVFDPEPEHWEWDLDMTGGKCSSVPEPPLPLQPTVPFQPRFLLQEPIRAHCPFQPRWSAHGSHLTECDWRLISLHAVRILCSPASFRLKKQQQQSSCVGASQTLGSGRSEAEPPCTELAHSGRSLGAQHGRTRHHPRGPRRVSRFQRETFLPSSAVRHGSTWGSPH